MYTFLLIVHILVCLFLIVVVLLQSGKAADLAGAFGGMGSQTAFGPRGSATVLSKATTISAVLFMVTSLSLSIMATRQVGGGGASVLERSAPPPAKGVQQVPAPAPMTGAPTPGMPNNVPGSADPKQPSVTIIDERTGESKTLPLDIPNPNEQPKQEQKAPAKKK